MTEIKKSDFEPILDKTFAEIFGSCGSLTEEYQTGCQKCHKGFLWKNPAKTNPDCSNVFCTKPQGHQIKRWGDI